MCHSPVTGASPAPAASRASAPRAALLLPLLLAQCGPATPPQGETLGGSLVISAFADADNLLPPLTLTGQGLQVVDAIFDRLAQPVLEPEGTTRYEPVLATRWAWTSDSLGLAFDLNPEARWHDGRPVTAADVRFTWLAYVDSVLGSPAAQTLHNIDSVQVQDSHTVTFWFHQRNPEQLADAAGQMRILPRHLLDSIPRDAWRTIPFTRAPVGTGRFRFGSWQAGSRLEIIADSANYRGRPGFDRVIWTVAPDPTAATMRLFAGDADFLESVRPDAAAEFANHPEVMILRSPSLIYGYLLFNLQRAGTAQRPPPLLGDRSLRRALSMAIDRELIVRAVFDSAARTALGPVTRIQLGADTLLPSLPFDTSAAARVLDSLGWRSPTPGAVRTRQGRPLQFTTLVPSSSTQRMRIAVLMQQIWRRLGVQMEIESVEFNTLNTRLARGDFDAALMALAADPSLGAIRGVWGSGASRNDGGVNFGNYTSARFDALLDSAQTRVQADEALPWYHEAYGEILADAPAIWLFEAWNLSGVRRNVHVVGLRPDGWWTQLGDWRRVAER